MAPERLPDRRSQAFIDPTAVIARGVRIAVGAVILGDVHIGEDTIVEPHAVIYPGVRVGARCLIGAGAVLGRPGFGWVPIPSGGMQRVPQLGGVLIEDDVDIGPLATVDAGTLDPTFIARGVRLDAHVHIGHNVHLGERTMVAAQSGFAGSVHVGADVRVGGQAGFADHVVVGDRAQIAAKSGVIGDIPKGGTVAGYPAVERTRWFRGVARMLRLVGK
jgi:UDP-3-O-[3-hydroxymyristoyl] glucosamine N-acyltransferase